MKRINSCLLSVVAVIFLANPVFAQKPPPVSPLTQQVKHVVIFIQENRSMDHMYGMLRGVRGFGDPNVVIPSGSPNIFGQYNGSKYILPFRTEATNIGDLDHSWDNSHAAADGGKWDLWPLEKGNETMVYYDRFTLGYYYGLADAYTVCDNYYCSVLGPTNPNRLYTMTGMIDPLGTGGGPIIDNSEPSPGFTWTTYPERLQQAKVDWKIYQAVDNYDDNPLEWFANFNGLLPGNPLYDRGLANVPDITAAVRAAVQSNTLPTVSWIVAAANLSEHPSYSIQNGEALTASLLSAINSNPAVANSTVLLLTYDENDGFYDHLPSPMPPPGTPQEFVNGVPIGLGPRVPMMIISPWTRGGKVCSQVFDHTSLIRFLEQLTGVQEPNISPWRRMVCGDLTAAFDFAHPDYSLPWLPSPIPANQGTQYPSPPASQSMPRQESGTKTAVALPYQPNVTSQLDFAQGLFHIGMSNAGTLPVHFSVFFNQYRTHGPYHYDVPAQGSLADQYDIVNLGNSKYDLSCFGPNGFLRRFGGNMSLEKGKVEVTPAINPNTNSLTLDFSNGTNSSITYSIGNDVFHLGAPAAVQVAAGAVVHTVISTAGSIGWYDLTITTSTYPSFLRQYAGRIENGLPGVTQDFGTKISPPPGSGGRIPRRTTVH